jgi:hypothetical protein
MPTARLTGRSPTISWPEQQDMGFWDNILARGIDGRVQIAYGHHRWEALKRVMELTDWIDIPIKDLDDATMLKVMANENMESWALGPRVIDETVRVTKQFLEEHPEELKKCRKNVSGPAGADAISKFLGWNATRVRYSLERLHLIDDGILDKESVESMPTDNAARELVDGNDKRIMRVNGNGEAGWWFLHHHHAGSPGSHPSLPDEPEFGALIWIESPPAVGPGIIMIVRRSEIGDQGWGWTGISGNNPLDFCAVLRIIG